MKKTIIFILFILMSCSENSTDSGNENIYNSKILGIWTNSSNSDVKVEFKSDKTFYLKSEKVQGGIVESGSFDYDEENEIFYINLTKSGNNSINAYVDVIVNWNNENSFDMITYPSNNLLFKSLTGNITQLQGEFKNCERFNTSDYDDGYFKLNNDGSYSLFLPPGDGSTVPEQQGNYVIVDNNHINIDQNIYFYQVFNEFLFIAYNDSSNKWYTFIK